MESILGGYFLYELFCQPPQREEGSPQGVLGNLAEKEGLVFKAVGCLEELCRCRE